MDRSLCASVIDRLSARVNRQQGSPNQGPAIEQSFYQCQNNVGQQRCVEVCADDSYPICFSRRRMKEYCDGSYPRISMHRNQFALSKTFDEKRVYIDYIVTNVLRQVAHHVSVDSLHQLSCCLPQNIEEILQHVTDIDSDRLVRILVTEVLQCYGTSACRSFDWYAFASSIKPLVSSQQEQNTPSSVNRKSIPQPEAADDIAKSEGFSPRTKGKAPSTSQETSSIKGVTPMKPSSSKETFKPLGTSYSKRTKPTDKPTSKDKQVPFESNSTYQSSLSSSKAHLSNGSDRSLDSECIVTVHHKHAGRKCQEKKIHEHNRQQNYHSTNSLTSSSEPNIVVDKVIENKTFNTMVMKNSTESLSSDSISVEQAANNSNRSLRAIEHSVTRWFNEIEQGPPCGLQGTELQPSDHPQSPTPPMDNKKKPFRINPYPNMLADID